MVFLPSKSCLKTVNKGIQEKNSSITSTDIVNLGDILERIDLVNLGLELTRAEHTEELAGVILELLTGLNVTEESRTSNLHALRRQFPEYNVSITMSRDSESKQALTVEK